MNQQDKEAFENHLDEKIGSTIATNHSYRTCFIFTIGKYKKVFEAKVRLRK